MKVIKTILKTPLFKITSLNSLSVVLKIGIGLITSKVIAFFVGPSGMALVGNLRNFIASLEAISTLGFQNGIVKYVAENKKEETELKKILSTIFISISAASLLLSGVLYFLSDFWNHEIFGNEFKYAFVFKALAAAMPWYASSVVLISIINGLSKFKDVIYITIFGNIIGLIISVLMIWQYRTFGALLAIIIAPSLLFFVALYYINREINLFSHLSFQLFSGNIIKKLASYSLMAFVSSVLSPLVFLAIRNNLIQNLGLEQAGFWEAITRISTYYLMFISTILTVYFLPKLVIAKTHHETKKVLYGYYKNIMPIFIFGLIVLFFIKDLVVHLLFTKAFLPVSSLFFWQIIGDVLKGFSLILGYNLIAKKHTIIYILTELTSMGTMFIASNYLVPVYGIEGIVMAHCCTYFVYLSILAVYFRKSLF